MRMFQVQPERNGKFGLTFTHDFPKGRHIYIQAMVFYDTLEEAVAEADRWENSGATPIIDGDEWYLCATDCSCPFHA